MDGFLYELTLLIYNLVSVFLNIWVVSTVVGVLAAVQILRGLYYKKDGPTLPVALLNCDTVVRELLKISPVGVAKGWHLEEVVNGVRLWGHPLNAGRKATPFLEPSHQWDVLAGTHRVELSPQEIMQSVLDPKELFSWLPGLNPPITLSQTETADSSQNTDTISFVLPPPCDRDGLKGLIKLALSLVKRMSFGYLELAGPARQSPKLIHVMRKWKTVNDNVTCMISQSDAPADLGYYWICYIFHPDKTTEISSFASFAAIPVPGMKEKAKESIASQLSALSQHLREKKSGFYRPVTKENFLVKYNTGPVTNPIPPSNRHVPFEATRPVIQPELGEQEKTGNKIIPTLPEGRRGETDAPEDFRAERRDLPPRTPSRYEALAKRTAKRILLEAGGKEESGWMLEGEKKGVTIYKKLPGPGEPPLNCVRGSGIVAVPYEFIFKFLLEPDTSKKLDTMLKEVEIIEEPEPFCRIAHLTYNPVRPTTARDFCVLSYSAKVDPHTFVYSATSVTHIACPETKSYVRAEVMVGGWVVRNNLDRPNTSHVTYLTQVDLKGYVPGFVVNKVTAMQPMRVDKLREMVEAEYQHALNNEAIMNSHMAVPIPTLPDPEPELREGGSVEGDVAVTTRNTDALTEDGANRQRVMDEPQNGRRRESSTSPDSLLTTGDQPHVVSRPMISPVGSSNSGPETYSTPDEMSSSGEGERERPWSLKTIGGNPVFEKMSWKFEPGTPASVSSLTHSEAAFSMPIRDSFVDFRTLANQVAASVYEETFNVSGIFVKNPATFNFGQKGWKYQTFEKDTVILRKKKSDSPFECFIGKTIIPLSPEDVFQHIRNPTMRYSYDNMLKDLEFIRRIDDDLYILHMVHETTHCLMKQARDFCLLVSERIMPNQLMIVGTSVDVPDCPVNPNIRRGRILTSGWVLEAHKTEDDRNHCSVTYLVQVDVGGAPPQLVNIISKRQPLAVAYLRDYLTGSGILTKSIMERQANKSSPSNGN